MKVANVCFGLYLGIAAQVWSEDLGTAFGVTVGKPLPDSATVSKTTTNGVIALSQLHPTNNIKYLQDFVVGSLITDSTNVVVMIAARGAFQSAEERDEGFDVLKEIINKKYKVAGARTTERFNQFEISQGSKSVTISKAVEIKQFPSSYTVTVQYGDEALANLALKIQRARKVQETPSTGL